MKKLSLVEKISELKKKRKAVILVHNYQPCQIQDIADYLGDSLELSRKAVRLGRTEVIVFCGVCFMAETASILCPDKKVLMPDINGGCPMADMVDLKKLSAIKKEHPGAVVVAYVNTTAEIKAESDICCTSANAVKVIQSLDSGQEIIFIPDKNLGLYVTSQTGRKMIYWDGYCHVHVKILPKDIEVQRKRHPQAEVMVHPECTPEVISLADRVLSTGGMCRYAKESLAKEIIVGTEKGIIYRLQKENPDKKFYPASELSICPDMKLTGLEKILWVLEGLKNEVKVPEEVQVKAIKAINKMLSVV